MLARNFELVAPVLPVKGAGGSATKAYLLPIASAAILPGGLSGCATTGSSARAQSSASAKSAVPLPGKPGSFSRANLNGAREMLNQTELLVYARLYGNPYRIKLVEPGAKLNSARSLGFHNTGRTGLIDPIRDHSLPDLFEPYRRPDRIPIVTVRQPTAVQANTLLVAHGLKSAPGLNRRRACLR